MRLKLEYIEQLEQRVDEPNALVCVCECALIKLRYRRMRSTLNA